MLPSQIIFTSDHCSLHAADVFTRCSGSRLAKRNILTYYLPVVLIFLHLGKLSGFVLRKHLIILDVLINLLFSGGLPLLEGLGAFNATALFSLHLI